MSSIPERTATPPQTGRSVPQYSQQGRATSGMSNVGAVGLGHHTMQ